MTIVCGFHGNWTVLYHTVMEVPVEHNELDYLLGDCVGLYRLLFILVTSCRNIKPFINITCKCYCMKCFKNYFES